MENKLWRELWDQPPGELCTVERLKNKRVENRYDILREQLLNGNNKVNTEEIYEYLVQWKEYPFESTWELEEDLKKNCESKIKEFEARRLS